MKRELSISMGVCFMSALFALTAGIPAAISALAGSLAILFPQQWRLYAYRRVMRLRRPANLAAFVLRSQIWFFVLTICAATISLHMLGVFSLTVAPAWILALAAQTVLPPLVTAATLHP